jgi:competence protein ComEC
MRTAWLFVAVFVAATAHALTITPSDRVSVSLNLRAQPSSSSRVVGVLRPGDTAEVIDDQVPRWYRVRLSDQTEGYVSKSWVVEAAPPSSTTMPATTTTSTTTAGATTTTTTTPGSGTASDTMTVHLIDVGQGAATLLEFSCGAVLVDTGGETNASFDSGQALLDYLNAFFARRSDLNQTLDALYLTHPHIDHTRNVMAVINTFHVKNLIVDALNHGSGWPQQQQARTWAENQTGVGERLIATSDLPAGQGLTDGVIDPVACSGTDPKLQVLWGAVMTQPSGWTATDLQNENNHSVVVRLDFGKASMLITGDLQETAIADLLSRWSQSGLLDTDIYEVGHHCSHNGTTADLLQAITPNLALIACGPSTRQLPWTAWQYGHPRQVAYDLLVASVTNSRPAKDVQVATGQHVFITEHLTKAIYATGWDGSVVVDVKADGTEQVTTVH